MLQQETHEYYSYFEVSNNLLELRNLLQVAELMVRCAMQRKEEPRPTLYIGLPGLCKRTRRPNHSHTREKPIINIGLKLLAT